MQIDCRASHLAILALILFLLPIGIGSSRAQNGKDIPTTLVFPTFLHTYGVRKATKFHLFLYVQNRVRVKNPQGIAATRLDSWDDPKKSKDDDEITVYGVNSGENVIIYNTSMTSIDIYGLNERGIRALSAPHGITAAPWGDVYVADTGKDRVVHLFNPGHKLSFVRELRAEGLRRPVGVFLAGDSSLYVTDTGGSRLLLFRADTLQRILVDRGKAAGQVWQPTGVAAASPRDRWNFYRQGFVVVIDSARKRIQKFRLDGRFLRVIRAAEFGYPDAELQYAAIDYYSQIWITDRANHCIHKFDRNLNYLDSFGSYGKGDRQFIEPRGISIYRRFGQVLIAEKEAAQYYWIGTDVKNLRIEPSPKGFLLIRYFLTEPSFVTVEIYDRKNHKLATALKAARRPAGANIERIAGSWKSVRAQRETDGPPPIPPGTYRIRFVISATYSSYKYFQKVINKRVVF